MPYFSIKSATLNSIAMSLLLSTFSYAQNTMARVNDTDTHAAHAAHQHGDHQATELELDHGQRWQTDAPLREGMARVRQAVADATRDADANGGLAAPSGQQLAAAIDASITYMVSNCHLEPAADANLHILIGRLAEAAALARQPAQSDQALPAMQEVLHTYPRYFDHPGW